jgi:hypothetical protein
VACIGRIEFAATLTAAPNWQRVGTAAEMSMVFPEFKKEDR